MTVSETMVERAKLALADFKFETSRLEFILAAWAEPTDYPSPGEVKAAELAASKAIDAIARAALTAALSDQAGGWQDISTAPKDGTHIDVWFVLRADHAARWPNVYWAAGKYWNGGPPDQGEGNWLATHWQRLPAPPSSSTAEDDR